MFILVSHSEARARILNDAGIPFRIQYKDVKESIPPATRETLPPEDIVISLARRKARSYLLRDTSEIVIGADTICWYQGKEYGKPTSETEALAMLRTFSGKTIDVYTGIALASRDVVVSKADHGSATLNELTSKQIDDYVHSGKPLKCAGALDIATCPKEFIKDVYNKQAVEGFSMSLFKQLCIELNHPLPTKDPDQK
ncbi:MAG: Maf family protein [Nanoarchaeota archaeon]